MLSLKWIYDDQGKLIMKWHATVTETPEGQEANDMKFSLVGLLPQHELQDDIRRAFCPLSRMMK